MNDNFEKLYSGVTGLAEKLASARQEISSLKSELGTLQKRACAEDLLLDLSSKANVPDALTFVTVEDFLDKRARLESNPVYMEKAANFSDFFEEGSGLEIMEERAKGATNANDIFNEWLYEINGD